MEMKKTYALGLTLFVVFGFYVVSASSAFAVEVAQWLVNGSTIALGESINVNAESEGNQILFEDMGATEVGTPDVLCELEGALWFLLSNGEGEIVSYICGKPVYDSGDCESPPVGILRELPWAVLVAQVGSEFESSIKADGKSTPGWALECSLLGGLIKETDTCTTENSKVLLENTADGLVMVEYMEEVAKAEQANCTIGGKEEGLITGLFYLHALNSSGELVSLSVSLAEEVS